MNPKNCRLCLQMIDNPKHSLIDLKFDNLKLYEIFEMCSSIQLKTEQYPGLTIFICEACIKDLIAVYTRIKKWQASDKTLKNNQISIKQEKEEVNIEEGSLEDKHPAENCDLCGKTCSKTFKKIILKQSAQIPEVETPEIAETSYQENNMSTVCEVCGVKVKHKSSYKHHMMLHTGEKPHICEFCGKGYIQRVTLLQHRKIHTGENPYICKFCEKRFRSHTGYKYHLMTHRPTDKPDIPCGSCDKVFKSKYSFQKHQLTHNKNFACIQCGRKFTNKKKLEEHTNKHLGIRPHICNICYRTFPGRDEFNRHKLIHLTVKPHPCDICLKRFITRTKVARHKRQVHSETVKLEK